MHATADSILFRPLFVFREYSEGRMDLVTYLHNSHSHSKNSIITCCRFPHCRHHLWIRRVNCVRRTVTSSSMILSQQQQQTAAVAAI